MGQRFIQGQIAHLTWVMVDSVDFATPESALSAATKIKIYGQLNGNSAAAFFVSSGTGSLTKDIQHVGASVLGIYTIPLMPADLSDASAAWYDTYIISLSATGAAFQTLIIDGERTDTSYLSNVLSYLSDIVSNINSQLVAGTFALGASNLSDIGSRVWADTIGTRVDSRVLLNQSRISDAYSMLSDFYSDFQSRVPKLVATNSQLSDLQSDLRSYLVIMSGVQSDVYSLLSDLQSDFQSRVAKRVATDSQLSDALSDIKSAIAGITASVSASDISDIASAVWAAKYTAHSAASSFGSLMSDLYSRAVLIQSAASDAASAAAQGNSRALLIQSRLSDLDSRLSSDVSDILSAARGNSDALSDLLSRVNSASFLSDIASHVWAAKYTANSAASSFGSLMSDIYSRAGGAVTASDISDIASAVWATALATKLVTLNTSDMSDIRSAIAAGPAATVTASDISDIASAVRAILVSDLSDILSAATAGASRALINQSRVSDVYSLLSDLTSDFQSRVPKRVATDSQLSDVHSDLRSQIGGITAAVSASDISDIASAVWATALATKIVTLSASDLSDIRSAITAGGAATVTASDISDIASAVRAILVSDLSDILSAAQQTNSRALVNQSRVSDIYSLLSDVQSDFQSRVPKAVATNSQLSDLASDLRSYLLGLSGVQSDIYSALSDFQSDFGSRVPKRVATDSQLSDLASDLRSLLVSISAISSDAHSAATQGSSRALVIQSQASDIYSLLSDVNSDLQSDLSSIQSDVTAIKTATASLRVKKNAALANFAFLMVDSTDHVTPETGLTITATRSIDGAAFAACANAASEIASGFYKINLAAADLNGDTIILRFTASGADARSVVVLTQA